MVRLIRLVIFLMLAFAGGVVFEKSAQSERCAAVDGDLTDGICVGASGHG